MDVAKKVRRTVPAPPAPPLPGPMMSSRGWMAASAAAWQLRDDRGMATSVKLLLLVLAAKRTAKRGKAHRFQAR